MSDQSEAQDREKINRHLMSEHPEFIEMGIQGFATSGRGLVMVATAPNMEPNHSLEVEWVVHNTAYWTFNTHNPDVDPYPNSQTRHMVETYDPTSQVVIMILGGYQEIWTYTVASKVSLSA